MSVQSSQDNYNRNTRPAKLAEKHENTIKQIKELQELERYMFANLQGINKSSPDANEQEERIRRRIQELVTIRQNLFGKLRGMYTSTQINVTKSREDLADQIAVGKTMEDELKNTEEQLEVLRAERAKKNNGSENSILPPIARIIATKSDKITIKLLTPLAIFCVFCLANQDNIKNTMTKIIIPVIKIFI